LAGKAGSIRWIRGCTQAPRHADDFVEATQRVATAQLVVAPQPVVNAQMVLSLLTAANVPLPQGVTLSTRANFADVDDSTVTRNVNAYGVVLPGTSEVLLNESWLRHWQECNVSSNIVSTTRHEATHAEQHRDGDTSSLDVRELEAYLCEVHSARDALANKRFAELPTLRQVSRARESAEGRREEIRKAKDTSDKATRLCAQFDEIDVWWPKFEAEVRATETQRGTYDGMLEPFRKAQMAYHAAYEAQNEELLRAEGEKRPIKYFDAGQSLKPHYEKMQIFFLQDIPQPPGPAFQEILDGFKADLALAGNWWTNRRGNGQPIRPPKTARNMAPATKPATQPANRDWDPFNEKNG
jgi:hypothetical protein